MSVNSKQVPTSELDREVLKLRRAVALMSEELLRMDGMSTYSLLYIVMVYVVMGHIGMAYIE